MTLIGPNFRVGAVTESVSEIRDMETLEQVAIPLTDKLTAGQPGNYLQFNISEFMSYLSRILEYRYTRMFEGVSRVLYSSQRERIGRV